MEVLRAAVPVLMSSFTERRWKSLFGLSSKDTETLWRLPQMDCQAKHLLWFLFFVKNYPTDSVASAWANCDEKTWRRQVRQVAVFLNLALPPVS